LLLPGTFLDCRDDYAYCFAQVMDYNKDTGSYHIHFDSWSKQYDEVRNPLKIIAYPLLFKDETPQVTDSWIYRVEEHNLERRLQV